MSERWANKIITMSDKSEPDNETALDNLGVEGWKVVAVVRLNHYLDRVYLTRPVAGWSI